MPRSSFQCTNSRAACCFAKSSSGSIASSRNLRARVLDGTQAGRARQLEQLGFVVGHRGDLRGLFERHVTGPANASLVAGQASTAFIVPSAARAAPGTNPLDRAIHSGASAKPRLRCSPHSDGPRRVSHPGSGAGLLGAGELLGDLRAHLTGIHAGIRGRQHFAKLNSELTNPGHGTPPLDHNIRTRKESHARQALEAYVDHRTGV